MESIWLQILTFALPSGFVSSVVTWLVTRQQRRNDFLAEMQKSIDLLSEKYNAVLQDNITLRQEKVEWKVIQKELLLKVDNLTREVENLRRNFNRKQKENETNNQMETSRAAAGHLADGDGLCGRPDTVITDLRTGVDGNDRSKKRKRTFRQPRRATLPSGGESDGGEPDIADGGRGSAGTDGAVDDFDAEPP